MASYVFLCIASWQLCIPNTVNITLYTNLKAIWPNTLNDSGT